MGKFARVCLKTRYIDYNGRLCMVSAGGRQQEGVRHRPGRQPWSDIPQAEVVWISGANVAECAPITTSYVWQARENGAQDHRRRSAHHADRPHLRPVPAGQARPRRRAVRRHPAPDDRERLARPRLHRRPHRRLREGGRGTSSEWTPRQTAEVTGIAEKAIRQAAEWWGTAKTSFLMHARGIEQHSHGVQNCLARSTSCSPPGGSAGRAAATRPSPARPTARAGASTARSADQLPGGRDIENPEHRAHVASVWGIDRDELPHAGRRLPTRSSARSTAARSGACSRSASTRWSRCRTTTSSRGCWRSSSSTSAIDFFLSETARYADMVLPGSLHEEDEGTVAQHRGPGHQDQQGRRLPRRRPAGLADHPGHRRRPSAATAGFTFDEPARDLRGAAAREPRAASPTTRASPTRRSSSRRASSGRARPTRRQPTTTPARRGCSSRARGTRSPRGPGRSISPTARPASTSTPYAPPTEDVDAEYPVILTTGRVVSQFLSGHPDPPHRPAGGPVPRAAASRCIRASPSELAIADGDWVGRRVPPRQPARSGARW